jgi:hypothetical protein
MPGVRLEMDQEQAATFSASAPLAAPRSPLRPIDLRLAPDGWCNGVLDLEPLIRSTHAVRGAKPLADDALAAERTGLLVNDRAVAFIGLVERNAVVGLPEELGPMGDEKKVAAIDFHDPEHTIVEATGRGDAPVFEVQCS